MKALVLLLVGMVLLATTAVAAAKEAEETVILITPLNGYLKNGNVLLDNRIVMLNKKLWRKFTLDPDADVFEYDLFNKTNNFVVKSFTVIIQFQVVQVSGNYSLPGRSTVNLLMIDFDAPVPVVKSVPAAPAISNKRSIVWASLKK